MFLFRKQVCKEKPPTPEEVSLISWLIKPQMLTNTNSHDPEVLNHAFPDIQPCQDRCDARSQVRPGKQSLEREDTMNWQAWKGRLFWFCSRIETPLKTNDVDVHIRRYRVRGADLENLDSRPRACGKWYGGSLHHSNYSQYDCLRNYFRVCFFNVGASGTRNVLWMHKLSSHRTSKSFLLAPALTCRETTTIKNEWQSTGTEVHIDGMILTPQIGRAYIVQDRIAGNDFLQETLHPRTWRFCLWWLSRSLQRGSGKMFSSNNSTLYSTFVVVGRVGLEVIVLMMLREIKACGYDDNNRVSNAGIGHGICILHWRSVRWMWTYCSSTTSFKSAIRIKKQTIIIE